MDTNIQSTMLTIIKKKEKYLDVNLTKCVQKW